MSDPRPALSAHLPEGLRGAVQDKLTRARRERVQERVRVGDATLWAPQGAPEVADRLGWLTIAERMLARVDELKDFAAQARAEGIGDVVLLGMGGSSLAAEVMRRSFGPREGWPRLHVLDSTDAATIRALERAIDPQRALFLVSSKSGGTVEPLSMWAHFWAQAPDGERFVAITDPGSSLEQLAHAHNFRRVFAGDPQIGGRYSALSPFGMAPAALAGWDIEALLSGGATPFGLRRGGRAAPASSAAGSGAPRTHGAGSAEQGAQAEHSAAEPAPSEDPEWLWLGVALSALAQAGRDKLTILPSGPLSSLGLWLEQLVAESTGKRGTGILPVAEEPLGAPGVYGADRVFLYLPDEQAPDTARDAAVEALATSRPPPDTARDAAVEALAQAGHPVITLPTAGPKDLGRVFMLAELAVAVAGWGLGINPFDQPNVQQAKDATNKVLERFAATGELPQAPDADEAALKTLLGEAAPPQYVAIMGYVEPSPQFDEAVAELRVAIRARTRATTTFGYGPRFLHSTGQFHKGGPRTGRFLQLLHDGPEDVAIPGAKYTFTTLKNAQAAGDLETLRELGLPAERVRLQGDDPVAALRELTAAIRAAE